MFILKYIVLFFFYSAAGWAVESTYRSIGEKRLLNSGFLYGPMCPIYGTGALVMTVCLYNPFYDRPLLVFVLGMVFCDIVEFITSLLMETLFSQRWWDYTYEFINIRGRICLKHTLYWGVGSVGFTYLVHPGVDKIVSGFSDKTMIIIVCAIFVVFLTDCVFSFKKALDIRKLQSKISSVKEKLTNAINHARAAIEDGTGPIGSKLDETNEKYTVSRRELYDRAEQLILHVSERMNAVTQKGKNKIKNRFFKNTRLRKNFKKELQRLEKLKDEIKKNFRN